MSLKVVEKYIDGKEMGEDEKKAWNTTIMILKETSSCNERLLTLIKILLKEGKEIYDRHDRLVDGVLNRPDSINVVELCADWEKHDKHKFKFHYVDVGNLE